MTQSSDTMEITVTSAHSLLDPHVFERVWSALREPLVPTSRYGRVQPMRHKLDADTRFAAAEFDRDRRLLFGDRSKRFRGRLFRHVDGLNWWHFGIDASLWSAEWMDWLLRLVADVPVLFASICSDAERAAKHATRRALPGAGSAHGSIGEGLMDFYAFLPGVYWTTILGEEAVSGLDLAAARACPEVEITEIPRGQVMLRFTSDPFSAAELADRLRAEKRVATALGDTYFFDRERTGRRLAQVPAVSAVLATLQR